MKTVMPELMSGAQGSCERPLMVQSILPQSQATPPGIVLQDGVVVRAQ